MQTKSLIKHIQNGILNRTRVSQQYSDPQEALVRRGCAGIACFVIFQSIFNVRDQVEMGGKPAGVGANLLY